MVDKEAHKTVAISFTEGRVVRDFFENGLAELLISQGYQVHFYTPAATVPSFISKWAQPGVEFILLNPHFHNRKEHLAMSIRKRVLTLAPKLLPLWEWIEQRLLIRPPNDLVEQLQSNRPDLLMVTNPMFGYEQSIFSAAQSLGIPTLGVLRSWDNFYRGLSLRPEIIAVWNHVNRDEAVSMMKYRREKVKIVGGAQFDAYFDKNAKWSREEFAEKLNLDASKAILTIAMLGTFQYQYDETYLVDWLVDAIDSGELPKDAQLICRLHPSSRPEYFIRYLSHANIRLSFVEEYIPTLGWSMTRDEVIFNANLLNHSDVVISPGSTITIEAAIFDTPTIVPIFHTYQPTLGKIQFNNHLAKHFKRLKEFDLVPFISAPEELAPAINKALGDPTWYKAQRKQLVDDYIQFTDGKSVERLAELIANIAKS